MELNELNITEQIETLRSLEAEYIDLARKANNVILQADELVGAIQKSIGNQFIKDGRLWTFVHSGYPVSVGYGNREWLRPSDEIPIIS